MGLQLAFGDWILDSPEQLRYRQAEASSDDFQRQQGDIPFAAFQV